MAPRMETLRPRFAESLSFIHLNIDARRFNFCTGGVEAVHGHASEYFIEFLYLMVAVVQASFSSQHIFVTVTISLAACCLSWVLLYSVDGFLRFGLLGLRRDRADRRCSFSTHYVRRMILRHVC